MPADALAIKVVDSTLAEPVAAATALCLALHASGDVGSESEVPGFAQGFLLLLCTLPYGSLRTCAGPRRSEQRS